VCVWDNKRIFLRSIAGLRHARYSWISLDAPTCQPAGNWMESAGGNSKDNFPCEAYSGVVVSATCSSMTLFRTWTDDSHGFVFHTGIGTDAFSSNESYAQLIAFISVAVPRFSDKAPRIHGTIIDVMLAIHRRFFLRAALSCTTDSME